MPEQLGLARRPVRSVDRVDVENGVLEPEPNACAGLGGRAGSLMWRLAKGDSADFKNIVDLTEAGEPRFYLRLIAAYRFFWFSEGA